PDRSKRSAHAVAKKSWIDIRAIDSRRDSALGEESLDVLACDLEHRPDESVRAHRMNATQTREARSRDHAHQNGFGLVVLLMRRCDEPRARRLPNSREACVTDLTRGTFEASLFHEI